MGNCNCENRQCFRVLINPCSAGVQIPIYATENANWTGIIEFNGTAQAFEIGVVNEQKIILPSALFNENYSHSLEVYDSAGALVNNTCYTINTMPSISSPIYNPNNLYNMNWQELTVSITEAGNTYYNVVLEDSQVGQVLTLNNQPRQRAYEGISFDPDTGTLSNIVLSIGDILTIPYLKSVLLGLLFLLAPMFSFGQQKTYNSNPTTQTQSKGGIGADSVLQLPGYAKYPALDSCRRLWVQGDSILMFNDCRGGKKVLTIKDTTFIKNLIASSGGGADSAIYATLFRLDTAKTRLTAADALRELLSNKNTDVTFQSANNTTYPTTLAVRTFNGAQLAAMTLQAVAQNGDSTDRRIKAKRLTIGGGTGTVNIVDSNGTIIAGIVEAGSTVTATGRGVKMQASVIDTGTVTLSAPNASYTGWNSGGVATLSGFSSSIRATLWKSAAYGLPPVATASGGGASIEGYIAQTFPSFTKSTSVVASGSAAKIVGLFQGGVDVLANDGGTLIVCDCRDSGKVRATENGAAFIGSVEQTGEGWSNGGGTVLTGLFNKGYGFSGRGIKDKFGSSRTDHGTFASGTTYWYSDVFGAYGDGSSNHGIAYLDSCVAMGDTNTHVMGLNVKVYQSNAFGFGRNFRTTRRDLFSIGFGSIDFQVDGIDKKVRINNRADTVASLADIRNGIPTIDQNCAAINLTWDTLGVTCHNAADAMLFFDTTGLTGIVNIYIDGIPYNEDAFYKPGNHLIYANLVAEPSCSKIYFMSFYNPPPITTGTVIVTPESSPGSADGVITVTGITPGATLFVDGLNTIPGVPHYYDSGSHEVVVFAFNAQFSGICADTTDVYIGSLPIAYRIENDSFFSTTTTTPVNIDVPLNTTDYGIYEVTAAVRYATGTWQVKTWDIELTAYANDDGGGTAVMVPAPETIYSQTDDIGALSGVSIAPSVTGNKLRVTATGNSNPLQWKVKIASK